MELFRTPISYYWENAIRTQYALGMMPQLVERNINWLSNGDINYLIGQIHNVNNLEGRVLTKVLLVIATHCPSQKNKVFKALNELLQHKSKSVQSAAQTAIRKL